MKENKKMHWEQVYQTKNPNQVRWTQLVPQTSLDFMHSLAVKYTESQSIGFRKNN
jgi:hypothetical protein